MSLFGSSNHDDNLAYATYIYNQNQAQAAAAAAAKKAADDAAAAEAKRLSDQNAAQAASDSAAADAARRAAAVNSGTTYLSNRLASEGLSPGNTAYNDIYNYYTTKLAANPTGDVSSYYTDAYSTADASARKRYNAAIDAALPYGYEKTKFGDTADDDILHSILSGQKTDALGTIDRAKSRGQLNDAGYAAAMAGLGDYETKGFSKLQDLGGSVLSGYRSNLANEENNIRNRANNVSLATNFDVNGAIAGINSIASGYSDRMKGDIENVVGDQKFFDIPTLLGKAGSASGFVNPGTVVTGGAPATPDGTDDKKRIQGNVGVF